jgi:Zn-dependent peptidase ImmA (M78 family)
MSHIDGVLRKEDIIEKASRHRDELITEVLDTYPRLAGRLPAELVADIIFDVCDWGVATYHLNPKQYAYCDFSSKRIFINSKLTQMAKKLKVDAARLQRTTLAHELGHIRLHADEMENRDFRSYLGPNMGYDDSRAMQRENEAELYAAVFLVPWKILQGLDQAILLREAAQADDTKELKRLNGQLVAINEELAERFGVIPNLMSRSLEAYDLIDRSPTRNPEVFKLSVKRRTYR